MFLGLLHAAPIVFPMKINEYSKMRTRTEYLNVASAGIVGTIDELNVPCDMKDDLLEKTDDHLAQVTIALTNVDEDQDKKVASLVAIFSSLSENEDRALCTALRYEWNGTGFESPPDLAKIHKDFEWMKTIRMAELTLQGFLQEKAKQRLPTPIEDIEQLTPLASLAFTRYQTEQCATEHDIKLLTKVFLDKMKVFKSLVMSVSEGAKQLISHIERQQDKGDKEKLKQEVDKKKEQEKAERARKAKEVADAKKNEKEQKRGVSSKPLLTLQEASVVLTSGSSKLANIQSLCDEAEFQQFKADKTKDGAWKEAGPYIVSKVPGPTVALNHFQKSEKAQPVR